MIVGIPALVAALAVTGLVAAVYAGVTKKKPRFRWLVPLFLSLFLALPAGFIGSSALKTELIARRESREAAGTFTFPLHLPEEVPSDLRLEEALAVRRSRGDGYASFIYEGRGRRMHIVTNRVTRMEIQDGRCAFHPLDRASANFYDGSCEVVPLSGTAFTLAIATDETLENGLRKAFAIDSDTVVAIYHPDLSRAELVRLARSLRQREPADIPFK